MIFNTFSVLEISPVLATLGMNCIHLMELPVSLLKLQRPEIETVTLIRKTSLVYP